MFMWPSARVGRIPIITMWAPTSADFASASLRLRRRLSSNVVSPPSRSFAGGTLISMLNWPSSVWKSGSAIASSASAFFSAGSPASSTRLSSTSNPVIGSSVSKAASRSIRAKTSRQRRTFSRCRVRSALLNSCASTSSPMTAH